MNCAVLGCRYLREEVEICRLALLEPAHVLVCSW
jgi:hypothetical protein